MSYEKISGAKFLYNTDGLKSIFFHVTHRMNFKLTSPTWQMLQENCI